MAKTIKLRRVKRTSRSAVFATAQRSKDRELVPFGNGLGAYFLVGDDPDVTSVEFQISDVTFRGGATATAKPTAEYDREVYIRNAMSRPGIGRATAEAMADAHEETLGL